MLSIYDFNGPGVKYLFSSFLLSGDNYISSPRLFLKGSSVLENYPLSWELLGLALMSKEDYLRLSPRRKLLLDDWAWRIVAASERGDGGDITELQSSCTRRQRGFCSGIMLRSSNCTDNELNIFLAAERKAISDKYISVCHWPWLSACEIQVVFASQDRCLFPMLSPICNVVAEWR